MSNIGLSDIGLSNLHVSIIHRGGLLAAITALALVALAEGLAAQVGPSPFRTVDGWAKLPARASCTTARKSR